MAATHVDNFYFFHTTNQLFITKYFIEVKTSLAAFGREKSMSWRHRDAIAFASTRIEFQEALIRFSKLGFPSSTWNVSEPIINS